MPEMDGSTATCELRKKGVQAPIIALTGCEQEEEQQKCHEVGCNESLTKPYDDLKLINCIARYIKNSKL